MQKVSAPVGSHPLPYFVITSLNNLTPASLPHLAESSGSFMYVVVTMPSTPALAPRPLTTALQVELAPARHRVHVDPGLPAGLDRVGHGIGGVCGGGDHVEGVCTARLELVDL